ncbi:sugar ABC transporter permease [Paenibacillus doosanensis]|uniref:L-arabinose transport system permease protein AraP n=1 Tax=Paenibacillus konkukensis TaxID=2020716 RepID=A0ABY4RJ07_9BACL|nr:MULTISPECIES: sugar ABC transporter permease [Paenibacillus]MCS7459777.1 sugar ABC transporter permease [Paenibacillus doosanensis]UQZ81805.1 L-arabinose transport system permease protein AraP [Paenibacillus konkukensis]
MKSKLKLRASLLEYVEGSIFIAPWFIGFLVFMAFPLGYSLFMSFQKVTITASYTTTQFVGWTHYRYILFENGDMLYNQLLPFLRQALFMIPIIVIFALLIAIILNQKFAGRTFFRAIFFLPVILSTGEVVKEFLTQGEGDLGFMSKYNVSGIIKANLSATWSGPLIGVLDSFVLILWYSGVQILIFLGGRQTISNSAYEAARIDGAGPWETFWKITLPAMTPFIFLNMIYTVVDLFTFPTNPILQKVRDSEYGQYSALIWIYFVIISVFLSIIFIIFSRATKSQRDSR